MVGGIRCRAPDVEETEHGRRGDKARRRPRARWERGARRCGGERTPGPATGLPAPPQRGVVEGELAVDPRRAARIHGQIGVSGEHPLQPGDAVGPAGDIGGIAPTDTYKRPVDVHDRMPLGRAQGQVPVLVLAGRGRSRPPSSAPRLNRNVEECTITMRERTRSAGRDPSRCPRAAARGASRTRPRCAQLANSASGSLASPLTWAASLPGSHTSSSSQKATRSVSHAAMPVLRAPAVRH